jgi:hypothetical protein
MDSITLVPAKHVQRTLKSWWIKKQTNKKFEKLQSRLKRASSNCRQILGHCFAFCGPTAQLGPRTLHCWSPYIKHRHTNTHTHTRQDSSERVTSSSQKPLPTQQTQKANIHNLSRIWTAIPAIKRPQTYYWDSAVTGTGRVRYCTGICLKRLNRTKKHGRIEVLTAPRLETPFFWDKAGRYCVIGSRRVKGTYVL